MASSPSALLLEQEERLLKIYQAELCLTKHRQKTAERRRALEAEQKADTKPAAVETADKAFVDSDTRNDTEVEEEPLDLWLNQQQQSASSDRQENLAIDSILHLQAKIRGFCFTSVHRTSQSTTDQVNYELNGYFTADLAIQALIRISLEFSVDDAEPSETDRTSNLRVLSLEYQLVSANDEESLEWLNKEAGETDDSNLPQWIQRISSYLDFDQRRRLCLQQWKEEVGVVVTLSGSKAVLQIPLVCRKHVDNGSDGGVEEGRETGPVDRLSLTWSWNWKQGRDELRLTDSRTSARLKQADLAALISSCGDSCEQALELLLPDAMKRRQESTNSNAGPHKRSSLDHDADDEGDDSDEEGERKLSAYELLRAERIKRNDEYMTQLGLNEPHPSNQQRKRRRSQSSAKKPDAPISRRRLSSRLRKQVGDESDEELLELRMGKGSKGQSVRTQYKGENDEAGKDDGADPLEKDEQSS